MFKYTKKVLKHFTSPQWAGKLKNPDVVSKVGNVRCGDLMWFYLKIKGDRIKEIKFQTYGCIAAIASADVLCGLARNKTIQEAKKITAKQIIQKLGSLPAIKYHCALLSLNALKKAIQLWEQKQAKKKQEKKAKQEKRKEQEQKKQKK